MDDLANQTDEQSGGIAIFKAMDCTSLVFQRIGGR